MERKVIIYLKRIVKSIIIILLWMIINTKLGIMNNYAFFKDKVETKNIIFYSWFLASLAFMLFLFYKIWKDDVGFDVNENEELS